MAGLVGYGAYIPYFRLKRSEIAAVLGEGGGKGTRAVASYDEDTTSMGVEAARNALRNAPDAARPQRVFFATASPPYLDKANATVIHAALDLPASALAVDMVGSVRSGVGAVLAASDSPVPAVAVLSDIRTGLAGGADERDGGDGAVALLFGGASPEVPVLAEVVAVAAATDEFLDRWRLPGAESSKVWEERFGEHVYGPLADAAFADALKQAGITPGDVDHLVVSGLAGRAVRRFATTSGVRPEAMANDLSGLIGNAGTAQAGIVLAEVLDRAGPGQTIVVVVLSDGASALVLRTTDAIAAHTPAKPVATQIAGGRDDLRYAQFLSWRGMLVKEPPRRPDPMPPAAPPAHRSTRYKFGFVGSRCEVCGAVHLPPVRVCMSCHAVDRMADAAMADVPATVATYTIDRLAYSPSPPVVAAVVDFDGGGRFKCQLTDVDPAALGIGARVEPTFRKLVTAGGVHNYFWKVRPVPAATPGAGGVPTSREA
ncbi:MAG: OB-fold domain-containing protein [Acidimicrobiia bacterium]